MYQSIYYDRKTNQVHIWDDKKDHIIYDYRPYAFVKSATGDQFTLDGTRVQKTHHFQNIPERNLFESDVPVETRVLIDLYGDTDEISENNRTIFFDIEVDISDKFPVIEEAENEVTAIAWYDDVADEKTVYVLDKQNRVTSHDTGNLTIRAFDSEDQLLYAFVSAWEGIRPTIVTGWNVDGFDIPYLYNRMCRVIGEHNARCLSPIYQVRWNDRRRRYFIAGVNVLDYMQLYKTFTFNEESSYSLQAISLKELDRGKIEYDGNLNDLFESDIDKYIEYNLNDVDLVVDLDKKLKFLNLARTICHKGHVPYEDVYMKSRYLDGAALTFIRRLGLVAPNRQVIYDADESPRKLEGAFVKQPVPGRYKWVYDLDLTSLYPSIIMTLNISPETKRGQIINWNQQDWYKNRDSNEHEYTISYESRTFKLPFAKIKSWLESEQLSIASNGVLYTLRHVGFLPRIISSWFDERVEYKSLMKRYGHEGDVVKYEYFDALQQTQKLMLNSFYGVLGLKTFRFHDIDNAEAITKTGQEVIKFSADVINNRYSKELGKKAEYSFYTDTDSTFASALPLIQKRYPDYDESDESQMIKYTQEIAAEMQDFINRSYDLYAQTFHNVHEHRWNIKQEYVARSGIWIAKKRYAQLLVNREGMAINKLDVKGLDVVRSSFPPAYRKFMSRVLEDILNDKQREELNQLITEFRGNLNNLDLFDIMTPTGVKRVSEYNQGRSEPFASFQKGTPVHVKAALCYNDFIRHYDIRNIREIIDGEKIKWCYLRQNPYGIAQCALKGYDDPKEIFNFVNEYIDREKSFESILEGKLNDFYAALSWGVIPKDENFAKFFAF